MCRNVVLDACYLVFIQMTSAATATGGIKFDPTHPAVSAASGVLESGELALMWAVGFGVGAVVPLVLSLVAARIQSCVVRIACGTVGTLCVVAGMLVVRGVTFGLI